MNKSVVESIFNIIEDGDIEKLKEMKEELMQKEKEKEIKVGRKKVTKEMKKNPVTIYLHQYKIDELGGIQSLRERLYNYVTSE